MSDLYAARFKKVLPLSSTPTVSPFQESFLSFPLCSSLWFSSMLVLYRVKMVDLHTIFVMKVKM